MKNKRNPPNQGLLTSEAVWRINSAPMKVKDAFDEARKEARDECLWLAAVCRELVDDNDRLRRMNEQLEAKLVKLERQEPTS